MGTVAAALGTGPVAVSKTVAALDTEPVAAAKAMQRAGLLRVVSLV